MTSRRRSPDCSAVEISLGVAGPTFNGRRRDGNYDGRQTDPRSRTIEKLALSAQTASGRRNFADPPSRDYDADLEKSLITDGSSVSPPALSEVPLLQCR